MVRRSRPGAEMGGGGLSSAASAVLFLAVASVHAQEKPPPSKPFVERVDVNVRSVLVVIRDSLGRRLPSPPGISDLEIRENGVPVEIVGVDAAQREMRASGTLPTAPQASGGSSAGMPASAAGIPQFLYLDTSFLQRRSVQKVTDLVLSNLDAILAVGPLEIVVADAHPNTVLESTGDRRKIAQELESLRKEVLGKELFVETRRQALSGRGRGFFTMMDARVAISNETRMLQASFDLLESWAAKRAGEPPGILYLANDGFDDPTQTYANYDKPSGSVGPGGNSDQTVTQLRLEFSSKVPSLVARLSRTLAGFGLSTVSLALGGSSPVFPGGAGELGRLPLSQMRGGTASISGPPGGLLQLPTYGLGLVADATGGAVVTVEAAFAKALERYASAYRVYFRSKVPADGNVRELDIRSRRSDFVAAGPRFSMSGLPESISSAQTVRVAKTGEIAIGGLEVRVSIETPAVKGNKLEGTLRVAADLAPIAATLDKLGGGRVRVTIAVEPEKGKAFVTSEEVTISRTDAGAEWIYEAPIRWPKGARRIAVTVEELKTGAKGAGSTNLPAL